jgi:hypothetical protein
MAASSFAQAALNAPKPSSSSYSTFMTAAFAALIYELDSAAHAHAAQSFDFGDDLADVFTSITASDAKELAAVAVPSFANFDATASPATAVYDGAFAFEFAEGDTIARGGSEFHVGDGNADSGSDPGHTIPQGSGSVNGIAATANEAPQADTTQAGRNNGPNHGQWQADLHASDTGSGAVKGQTHEASGDDLNHGQSQKALHASDNGSGAANGHAKQGPQADINKPQHDLQTASVNSANNAHSALKFKAGGKDGTSSDDADQTKSAVGTELGDSFHFKNGANNASSDFLDLQQPGHGSEKAHGDDPHAVAHKGPVSVQDADAIDPSAAHHDHSAHTNHYAAHDLIV